MRPRQVTLQQVAQRAGVSRTTASFVLTGRDTDMRISNDARDRVLQAARELDYRPNRISQGLRTNVTHTIGLVSDTIATEPFAGEAIHGAVTAALAHDRMLFVVETEGDTQAEDRLSATCWTARWTASFTRRCSPGRSTFRIGCRASRWFCSTAQPSTRECRL